MKIEISKEAAHRARERFMADAELGMTWWNGLTKRQRAEALRAANTDVPAVAWEHWRAGSQTDAAVKP
jgi:hypothetical protein